MLPGGRLTLEDAYAYAKFARVALGTNDVDFRARPHSAEEAAFLAATCRRVAALGVTYADLEAAPSVLLVGSRARGGVADHLPAAAQGEPAQARRSPASRRTPPAGSTKLGGTLLPAVPGAEAAVLDSLVGSTGPDDPGRGRG